MYFGIYFFTIIEFTHGMIFRRDLPHAGKEKKLKMVFEKKNKTLAVQVFERCD